MIGRVLNGGRVQAVAKPNRPTINQTLGDSAGLGDGVWLFYTQNRPNGLWGKSQPN